MIFILAKNFIFNLISSNIFVNGANLVIGDFGHAKLCENNSRYSLLSRPFGTECYNAPEANKPNYSNKVDIWYL
jgi:serine/threonine protein kinase